MHPSNYMDITEVIIKIGDNYFRVNCISSQVERSQEIDLMYMSFEDLDSSIYKEYAPGLMHTTITLEVIGDPILTKDLNYKEDKTIFDGLLDVNKMINARRDK